MIVRTDSQLLRDFAEHRSEEAFAELVRRHLDFVHSAARRLVRDELLAQDVTQGVFAALAENAATLIPHPVLSGWLHRTARNLAAQTIRTDVRRQAREQEAAIMQNLLAVEPETHWENVAPLLDEAMDELPEPDRHALLLRYFERKSAREMAETLGISEEAAQKRCRRALEKLRDYFVRQGVPVGTAGLVAGISVHAVEAAPVGLAATISAAGLLSGASITTTTASVAAQTIAMTTLQKSLVVATLTCAVGIALYQGMQASAARKEAAALRWQASLSSAASNELAQLGGLRATVDSLQSENAKLTAALAKAREQNTQLGTARTDAERRAQQFKELANAAQRPGGTNQYPTARHFLADFGRTLAMPVKMGALLMTDDSQLTPEQQTAKAAAHVTMLEKMTELAKASKQFASELEAAGTNRADMVAVLLYGAFDLSEPQFSQAYSILQRHWSEAERQNLLGKSPSPEAQQSLAKLNEQARAELQVLLTPEQNKWLQQMNVPLIEGSRDDGKTSFQYGFGVMTK
jgi:RNA polymerase sigma factor (sigma-70 family)